MEPIRIFTIYSPEDEKHCKTLDMHLHTARKMGHVTRVYDPVERGDALTEVLEQRFEAAQILLVLVTVRLFADEDSDARVERALARAAERQARVIPILVDSVDLGSTPLARLAPLPRSGKPISGAANADAEWAEIAKEIRLIAERMAKSGAEGGFALRPAEPKSSSESAALRKLINELILSDSDLEAFCMDHFPQVQQRFANGMDRVQKVNILLTYGTPERIRTALQQSDPGRYAEVSGAG